VEQVRLFGPPPASGTRVTALVRVHQFTELQVRSDIDVVGPDGRLLMQAIGWANRRFDLPPPFDRVWKSPRHAAIGAPWPAMMEALGRPAGVDCRLIDHLSTDLMVSSGRIWQRGLVHLVLTQRERSAWKALQGSDQDPGEWLLGRAAAKEAARGILRDSFELDLYPADVEVLADGHDRFTTTGSWAAQLERTPVVSLSYCDGAAVAVAGDGRRCAGVGIKLSRVGPNDTVTLDPQERALVTGPEIADQQEWAARVWCAKQAASKALGRTADDPPELVAAGLDVSTGGIRFAAGLSPDAATSLTPDAGQLTTHTVRDGDWVAAVAIRWNELTNV
jgi:phosphopantetheinyl transferase (holo-ACP synthase)